MQLPSTRDNGETINMNNSHESESLSKKVIRGGIWVFALKITSRGLGFIKTIIIARLLAPEDFGLFGIAMLAISTLETFSQTGFQMALIQKKENVESYLDTSWTVSAIRGILLFLILFFSAPLVATFFNSPKAILIIKVIAISTLISGFGNIGIIFFKKELEFHKQFIYEFSATLVGIIVAITLAFILRNVWAIVWGGLASNIVLLFMSYILHPYRPHVRFDKSEFKGLFGFGKWVLGSSILMFLITQGDDIFVGKLLGVAALGFYQLAYTISNMPATEVTHVISQVTFPIYSKLQDNIPRLREAYLKVLQVTAFLSIPITGLIFILATDFTMIFLGEKWMPMVPAMKGLVFWGLIRSIGATTGPIIYATGKPKILVKYQLFQLIMLIILIYPLTVSYGILGTALTVLFASMGPNILAFYAAIKITNCGISNFIRTISFPLTSSLVAIVAVFLLKIYCAPSNALLTTFILSIICYGLVYLGINYLFERFSACNKIEPLIKEIFLTLKG